MIRGGQILNRQRQRDSQGKRSLSAEEFVGATVMSTHLARAGQFGYGGQFTTKVGSMMASVKEAHTGQVLPVDLTFPPVLYNKVSLVECLVACVSRVMVVVEVSGIFVTPNPASESFVSSVYYKSVDQESSLFLTMDSQTSSPVGPAA
jgi:hypothetical protein